MPVRPVEGSDKSRPNEECPICHDTGVMRWTQHAAGPNGEPVAREMEHPCVNGCGGVWKQPAAESSNVVDAPDDLPAGREHLPSTRARGLADEANAIGTDFIVEFVKSRGLQWGESKPDV